jgi:hypothetical protein
MLYRKGAPLRIRRAAVPEPPYWCATIVAPYGPRRATPLAIDYLELRAAAAAEKQEVPVAERVRDELERNAGRLDGPVLIEATEVAEEVFGRGEEALAVCGEQGLGALHLVSARGALPQDVPANAVIAISAWPLELYRLQPLFDEARARGLRWGVAVPVIYPVTVNSAALEELAAAAQRASFLAPLAIALEPTAKEAMARSLAFDEESYATLFHSDLEPLHLAAERRIAALAAERNMADFITPPGWEQKSNWNASVLLTLTASRMIAMQQDLDVATAMSRSARLVAELDKPLERIAGAASLGIVGGLDETSIQILEAWLKGEESIADDVNEQWRS